MTHCMEFCNLILPTRILFPSLLASFSFMHLPSDSLYKAKGIFCCMKWDILGAVLIFAQFWVGARFWIRESLSLMYNYSSK